MNILVLSAGGPAAVGVIKSLRDMNFDGNIISIDYDELAVGFHLSDSYYIVPHAGNDELNFILHVKKIIKDNNISLILPSGPEIVQISYRKKLFESMGVRVFMSDYESIQLCRDKFIFYKKCKNKFLLPKTSLYYSDRVIEWFTNCIDFPLFAKPRMELGGSKGAMICKNFYTLEEDCEYIYQEILPGQEYTIDVLCDMESNPLVVIPRKRLQIKAGISSKGEIIKNGFIEKACFDMCKFLKLKGPVCLQMKEDIDGTPKFIEVNPRFGGGTYFTTLAGVNFCKLIIDMVNGKELVIPEPKLIKILRYYEEVII